jgi:hypothetical protein
MKIFCDYVGHFDLLYSLFATLSKRLGHEMSVPNHDRSWAEKHKLYNIHNESLRNALKGFRYLSHEEFIKEDFDIVICTAELNEKPMKKLFDAHGACRSFVRHIGNLWEQPLVAKNVMAAIMHPMKDDLNILHYIPEHPGYFRPRIHNKSNELFALDNYTLNYEISKNTFNEIKKNLKNTKSIIRPFSSDHKNLVSWFNRSKAYVHLKANGGCGFTLREALFCAIPVIVNMSFVYSHFTIPTRFLKDGVNCIDFDTKLRPFEQSLEVLEEWLDPSSYQKRCWDAVSYSKLKINFEKESESVNKWFNKL